MILAELPYIKKSKRTKEINSFYLVILPIFIYALVIIPLGFLGIHSTILIALLGILIFVDINYGRTLFPDWIKEDDIIGNVIFTEDRLTRVGKKVKFELEFKEFSEITFYHNYIKGQRFSSKDIKHNGLARLEINFKNGNKESVKILIENGKQLNDLKLVLRVWYKMGIRTKEYMGHSELKTILFKSDHSFDEIQRLKKELNVSSFYNQ
ncbi:hypothetical protein [Labilibacter marinus]|uniref:hypothetical protein n=1 Tax=Labilibacter marinus TaxID=1477105 RepID=UPI00094F8A31|nr:hypothetical protein [Labilibacter marinus]